MIRVQAEPFDFAAEAGAFGQGIAGIGAIVTFSGIVRGPLAAMEIEHYPGMTESALAAIEAEAVARWGLLASLVIHRHGRLLAGEMIMMVATAASHRGEAFAAAEFLMDFLKSRAPFWKKEIGPEGAAWVAAKSADEAALDRW